MSNPPGLSPYADRWHALLADHRGIQDEIALAASFIKPLSRQQMAELKVSAARLEKLSKQVRELVDEWAAAHE
jgi:hypothetical protein